MSRDTTSWTVWAAITGTLPIYPALGLTFGGDGPVAPVFVVAVHALALGLCGAWLGAPVLFRTAPARTRMILRCALGEAVAIQAFLLAFLGASVLGWAPLFGLGALLVLISFPRAAAAA